MLRRAWRAEEEMWFSGLVSVPIVYLGVVGAAPLVSGATDGERDDRHTAEPIRAGAYGGRSIHRRARRDHFRRAGRCAERHLLGQQRGIATITARSEPQRGEWSAARGRWHIRAGRRCDRASRQMTSSRSDDTKAKGGVMTPNDFQFACALL